VTVHIPRPRGRPRHSVSALLTVAQMESRGFSHSHLEGFRSMSDGTVPSRQRVSATLRQSVLASQEAFGTRITTHGRAVDTAKLIHKIFAQYLLQCVSTGIPPVLDKHIRVKVTLDARAVSNDGVLHTEMMLVLLQPDTLHMCQQPSSHFSVAVYIGKDDTAHMRTNLGLTVTELQTLESDGLSVNGVQCWPTFVFPADMATHWAWFCAGGVHDELFCHRCSCHRDNRACVYDWYTLPPAALGDRWTLSEAARHVRLNVDDFVYLNTQHGVQEENLLEHHITFQMPQVSKRTRAHRGVCREDAAHTREQHQDDIQTALAKARGTPADAHYFRKCIRLWQRPASDAVPPGSPRHDGTVFCECH